MLDDILEIALEVGGEVLEAVVEHHIDKRRKTKKERSVPLNREPWERAQEKPPWEDSVCLILACCFRNRS